MRTYIGSLKMGKMIVDKEGGYECNGNGKCGGTNFINRENVMNSFHCENCPSFKREGLKIIDKRNDTKLTDF